MNKLIRWGCAAAWSATSLMPAAANTETAAQKYPPVDVRDTPLEYRQFEKVEITGSSIVRKEQTQALPVHIYTRDELLRSGLRTVAEVIQKLPEMGQLVEAGQLTQLVGGYSTSSIHGLNNGTLVLVNGLRLAPFGRPTMVGPERSFVDVNTLPMADIDRIEVLSDGASSLYGTDAIAGVVNIILRQERRGWEITADKTLPKGQGGQGETASLSWGAGNVTKDGYSLLLTAELGRRQALLGGDRPYASQGRYTFEKDGRTWQVDGLFQTLNTTPVTFRQRPTDTTSFSRVNGFFQDGQCIGNTLRDKGQPACAVNAYSDLSIYPEEDTKRLHGRAQWALPNNAIVFTEALYGQYQATSASRWWSPSYSAYGLPEGSAASLQAQAAGLDPANTRLLWRPNLPALSERSLVNNTRFTVGIKGEWNDWDYRASAYSAQNQARWYDQVDGGLFYDSLGLGANQIWSRSDVLQPLSADNPLRNELLALRGDYKLLSDGQTKLRAIEARASRSIGELNGKDIMLGVGLDARQEQASYSAISSQSTINQPSFDTSRQVNAAYAELMVPVTPSFEINTALRHDAYSDVGATTNGKLSTRWEFIPQWSVRGSVGSGFRAPSPAQMKQVNEPFMFGQSELPLSCSPEQQRIAANLKTASGTTGFCTINNYPWAFGNGNPNLKPETSRQENLGLAFMPHANMRWSVDLWRVRIKDTIRYLAEQAVLDNPSRYANNYTVMPDSAARLGFTPGDLSMLLTQQNSGQSEKSGLDMEVQWRKPTEWGRLNFSAKATYMLRSTDQADANSEMSSDLGRFNTATGTVTPRIQARITTGLTNGTWSTTLAVQHVSGYKDIDVYATDLATGMQQMVQGRHVRSFTTLDVFASWMMQQNTSINFGIRNLFDQDAPQTFAQSSFQVLGANTRYANLWGRTLQLGITTRF